MYKGDRQTQFRTGCLTTEYTEHTEKAKYERTFRLKK